MFERGRVLARVPSRARHGRKILAALVAVALFVLVVALWTAPGRRERSALMRLPAIERRALYERTLRTLESTCSSVTDMDGLAERCGEQAEFILQFPECDAACAKLAQARRGLPSR